MATEAVPLRRRGRALAGGLVAATLLLALVVVQRDALLTWVGGWLIAQDELVRADAIVVLAGGPWDRDIEAAELFREGYAPQVVLTVEPRVATIAYLAERGIEFPPPEENRIRVLSALGVPRERIVVLKDPVTSTLDEARFVGAWAERSKVRTVIVVSSPHHTARARYVFGRYAATDQTRFVVRPSRLGDFKPDAWWTSRATLRDGIIELQKLIAYRLRY